MTELAILGGAKTREAKYPEWPIYDERDIEAVTRVIRSGNWGGFPYPGVETQKVRRLVPQDAGREVRRADDERHGHDGNRPARGEHRLGR